MRIQHLFSPLFSNINLILYVYICIHLRSTLVHTEWILISVAWEFFSSIENVKSEMKNQILLFDFRFYCMCIKFKRAYKSILWEYTRNPSCSRYICHFCENECFSSITSCFERTDEGRCKNQKSVFRLDICAVIKLSVSDSSFCPYFNPGVNCKGSEKEALSQGLVWVIRTEWEWSWDLFLILLLSSTNHHNQRLQRLLSIHSRLDLLLVFLYFWLVKSAFVGHCYIQKCFFFLQKTPNLANNRILKFWILTMLNEHCSYSTIELLKQTW